MASFATISDAQSFVFDASEFLVHLADELRYETDPDVAPRRGDRG